MYILNLHHESVLNLYHIVMFQVFVPVVFAGGDFKCSQSSKHYPVLWSDSGSSQLWNCYRSVKHDSSLSFATFITVFAGQGGSEIPQTFYLYYSPETPLKLCSVDHVSFIYN